MAMGIRDRPIARGSPWQNGFAERLIGSIRRECVDHIVILGETHLRWILRIYARYYNDIRTHWSLNKDTPVPRPVQRTGDIKSHALLGGLHHHYVRVSVFVTHSGQVISEQHFVEFKGRPVKSAKTAFKTAVSLSGLEGNISPHTLSHTTATWLMQIGTNIWEVAGFVGTQAINFPTTEVTRELVVKGSSSILSEIWIQNIICTRKEVGSCIISVDYFHGAQTLAATI